jgi:hypothetical protein
MACINRSPAGVRETLRLVRVSSPLFQAPDRLAQRRLRDTEHCSGSGETLCKPPRNRPPQCLPHPPYMRAMPVHLAACGAAPDRPMDFAQTGRQQRRPFMLFERRRQHAVAQHAAREKLRRRRQVQRRDEFPQLVERVVLANFVGACGMQFAQQVPVARQQDSFFSMSEPHQGGISQCRVVAGVEAEYAQPAGKTAEHGISGETWRGHLFSMPVVLAIPELDKVPVFTLHKLSLDLMSILNAKLQR